MEDAHIIAEEVSLSLPRTSFINRFRRGSKNADQGAGRSEFLILDRVSFKFQKGEAVGILGRNGAGKSSLLRLIAEIYFPTRGSLRTLGKKTAIFSLNVGSNQALTGRQNIELRGRLLGLSKDEIESREQEIIEFADLGEHIDMPLHTYSSGMALRLAFATTTAVQPEILLMDEWIGAGDREFREKADERIGEMSKSAGILVLASHNRNILKQYCRRGLVLDKGKLQFDGPLEEALEFGLS